MRVQEKLRCDTFYRALHVKITKLFAEQLKLDKGLLVAGEPADLKKLSLAAKWVPTFGEFHDRHTFILSSIAELLFPDPAMYSPDATDRELFLRHVRELFRKQYSSPLRKALCIVERDIAAKTFTHIDYSHVPSVAMDRYTGLFVKRDHERFTEYIDDVANGDARISGATLLPSTLVSKACDLTASGSKDAAVQSLRRKVIDGQWRTLVQSVRNAGTLQSSVAVCDVSGSMFSPKFKDGSAPVHSAIGLSLLIAELSDSSFGRCIVTFSESPQFFSLDNELEGMCDTVDVMQTMP